MDTVSLDLMWSAHHSSNFNSKSVNFLRYLLVVSFFLTAFISSGQVFVGPVIGGQLNSIIFDDKTYKDQYGRKPFIGFHAGASVSLRMQKRFFLQSSILYSQRGKTITGKDDKDLKNKVRYGYIDMPILFNKEFRMKFGKKNSKYYNVLLGAGPLVSYWLNGKGVLNSSDLNESLINPPNYDLPYHVTFGKNPQNINEGEMNVEKPNRIQLGLTFSAGVVFEPVGFNKFVVTASYDYGHSFFSQDSKGDFGFPGKVYYYDNLQVRNQSVAISVFYFIDLKLDQKNKGKSTLDINKINRKK